jgi:double zinc ribbon protein
MSKLCSVCGTENRDEAQFCRACGTAFTAMPAASSGPADASPASNVCVECHFQNKPGIRYCANCGMSLAAPAAADAASAPAQATGDDPYAGLSPPPISYPSFATVPPYPPAPSDASDYAPLLGDQPTPHLPDPQAEIGLRRQEAAEGQEDNSTAPFQAATEPRRAPLVVGGVIAVLAIAGVAAWLFMGRSNPAPPQPGATVAPVLVPPLAASASTAPIIIEEAPATSAAAGIAGASAAETPTPPAATGVLGPPPTAAAPLPQLSDTPTGETPEAEAKRLAAEKRRDKAARDKADREAKAKAASEQRDQAMTTQRADQDAQARRRAEDAQRNRSSAAAPAAPVPQSAQARGVQELCAGRGAIAEAVCQSRECAAPGHANEPLCRRLREADERRRNL